MAKKIFVLDTNVILHDYECLFNFEDNDVVIPITVLEEIDAFKRGHDQINYNAREFIRILDTFSGEKLMGSGVPLGPGLGQVSIDAAHLESPAIRNAFIENKADHRILSVAHTLTLQDVKKTVILVSKDVNLRLKAKSLGVLAEDYFSDRVRDFEGLYPGKQEIGDISKQSMEALLRTDGSLTPEALGIVAPQPHEFFILKNKRNSLLGYFNPETGFIHRMEKPMAFGIVPRNAEQCFALKALLDPAISLVTLSGKAGTGKTLLALAAALEVRRFYHQIFLARPIIPLSNRDLGYLPGDIEKKLDPYMQPLYDNLNVIQNQYREGSKEQKNIKKMLESEKLFISPLAYIRGRSLEKIFFIVDEAQNLTPHEVKTIITRAGEGTKIVFTGDPYQIDTPYLDAHSTGLTVLIERMKGQRLYAHITLEKGERSPLAELASNLL
jgi:PhoH-like ATPase